MAAITVADLAKTYTYYHKEPGLRGSLKALLRRQTLETRAVGGISFAIRAARRRRHAHRHVAGDVPSRRYPLGGLSPWLLRPSPLLAHWIGNNIGEKVVKLPLLLPLVGLVAVVFRADLRLPADPRAWLLFVLCLPMAAVVAFLLDFVTGSLAFWIQDVKGLDRVKRLVTAFLAGQFVPLALFPPSLLPFLEALPFRCLLAGAGGQPGYAVLQSL